MIRRFLAAAATAVVLTFGAVAVPATPAQAAFSQCPIDGWLCLWKWINYEGGMWGVHVTSMDGGANWPGRGPCLNLSGASFGSPNTGAPVNNESASFRVQEEHGTYSKYVWRIYDWVNCNSSGGYINQSVIASDWNGSFIYHAGDVTSENWYHRATSLQLVCFSGTQCGLTP